MQSESKRQVLALFLIALLWGFLLNGFFLYLPYLAEKNLTSTDELIAAFGWLGICVVSALIGRNFSKITRSGPKRIFLIGIFSGLAALGVMLHYLGESSWSWFPTAIAASIALSLVISRTVYNTEPKFAYFTSAAMGATPLVGSLFVSLGFALAPIRENYLILVAGLGVIGLWPGLFSRINSTSVEKVRLAPGRYKSRVLGYAFLLGLGVALINTYVFERVSEVLTASADKVANQGSLLVALASLAGVIASLLVAAKFLARFQILNLARFGSVMVTAGAVALVVAPDVTWVGIAGVLVGAGFGLSNGLELNLVASATNDAETRTALFGYLVAVTTVPFVFATLIGFALASLGFGTTPILTAAAALSGLSVVALVRITAT